mmetsp:Transcript_88815/g.206695  ORF Transcript_88815/g.206695 Transcript_88815/m.206695 type:complete len:295 (-) Transcript_88815:505-1389(-)
MAPVVLPDEALDTLASAPPREVVVGHRLELEVILLGGAVAPSMPRNVLQDADIRHDVSVCRGPQVCQVLNKTVRVHPHKGQGVGEAGDNVAELGRVQLYDLARRICEEPAPMHPLDPQRCFRSPRPHPNSGVEVRVRVIVPHVSGDNEEHLLTRLARKKEVLTAQHGLLGDGLDTQLHDALTTHGREVVKEGRPGEVGAVQLHVEFALQSQRQELQDLHVGLVRPRLVGKVVVLQITPDFVAQFRRHLVLREVGPKDMLVLPRLRCVPPELRDRSRDGTQEGRERDQGKEQSTY